MCKSGSDWGIYLDGSQEGYVSNVNDVISQVAPLRIGSQEGTLYEMEGWIDEARIVQGNPYGASPNSGKTDTITVPTSAHTATSDTVFLCHFENTYKPFEDTSASAHDVENDYQVQAVLIEDYRNRVFLDDGDTGHLPTALGSAKIDWISVFGNGALRNTGSPNYLYSPDSDDWILGTDFSVGFWVKFDTVTTANITGQYVGASNYWYMNWSASTMFSSLNGATLAQYSTFTPIKQNWYYVELNCEGGVANMYVNGKKGQTSSTGNDVGDYATTLMIANLNGSQLDGWLDEYRIVNGRHLHINNFVPASGSVSINENMRLVSASGSALTAPASGQVLTLTEDLDGLGALNTDFNVYSSRDGGTTWNQATLTRDGAYTTDIDIVSGYSALGAQPSDTEMKYKIETTGQTRYRVHGTSLLWK
jgi:hypothetical protein